MGNKFYVTTAIDYTNDVIHIGHAYQKIVADIFARYHRQRGDDTFFLTGTDEHGGTSEQAAKYAGKSPTDYVNDISLKDKKELDTLNISYDRFIRTTDEDHIKLVVEFYKKVKSQGDIYKGEYKGYYCTGCESAKNLTEIVDGKCPLHPTRELEEIKEENYFFAWSKYQDFLTDLITNNPEFIKPESQRKNMLGFLKEGLTDIAISRPITKVGWGIPVPDDPTQVIYVWFDALINYISGAPEYWPATLHILGKDNVRWHALLWPAMLKSAGFELPKTVYGHGFITLNGEKISKSKGNIIRPSDLVNKYGADPVRYYFAKFGPWVEDTDISEEKLIEVYNSDLANGLGNLVARTAKLCENNNFSLPENKQEFDKAVVDYMEALSPQLALDYIWTEKIQKANKYIDENKPWELKEEKLKEVLTHLVQEIRSIAFNVKPFLPIATEIIENQFGTEKIISAEGMFPRIK
jgi:methionyl-tRNA synthetase